MLSREFVECSAQGNIVSGNHITYWPDRTQCDHLIYNLLGLKGNQMVEAGKLSRWVKNVLSEFALEKKTEHPYSLVDYHYSEKAKKFLITVQLKYKNIQQEIDPEALLKDNTLVRMMSQENIRLITYLACKNSFSITYKVVAQNFHEAGIKNSIEIRHVETNKLETKLISEILSDKDYLHKMQQEDIFRIGFAAGAASVANEQINFDHEA